MMKITRKKCELCRKEKRADPPIVVRVGDAHDFEVCETCALLLNVITERLEQEDDGEEGEDEPVQDY